MVKLALTISLLIGSFNLCLFAQHIGPIEADRPDQTETTSTVPAHHFQMENGISFEQTDANTQTIMHPSTLIKYGVNDAFELRLITELATIASGSKTVSGLQSVTVGFKVNLASEKGILPALSFLGHLAVPDLASYKFQSSWYAPSFRFSMSHTLTPRLSLGYNVGAEWDGETPQATFIYTLSTAYALSEKLGTYVEIFGFAPQKSRADHLIDGGFNYLLKQNISLDVSGGVGLTETAPDYYFAAGFSFRLGN